MTNELYDALYQYIKGVLLSDKGLRINYNMDAVGRVEAMDLNQKTLAFMMESVDNEKQVIDYIIDCGQHEAEAFQRPVNFENVKSFLTSSTIVPLARKAYQKKDLETIKR